ncbi:unnamed protein product [Caenorhabditis angaria]|uniref:Thioredoxin domain-containing protein n=1 Tax=Caenorhabditis angaria TaxID=860376 RepID=A0A9P1N5N5_9PELO|nr:unnamed protein product [Caenorhabditis angaria]
MFLLIFLTALVNSQPFQLQDGVVLSTECKNIDDAQKIRSLLFYTCPLDYDPSCADPIFDPFHAFHFRCQLKYDTGLLNLNIQEFTNLLNMDHMNHSWCMITFLYSNNCPFSYTLAPEFNKLTNYYQNIYFVGMNAFELKDSKINVRSGLIGTPTVALWVNGVIVARMYHQNLDLKELQKFIGQYTDLEPKWSANRGNVDSSIIVRMDEEDIIESIYTLLCFLVVILTIVYQYREYFLATLPVFKWIRTKFGAEKCEIFYHLLYVVPPRIDQEFVIVNEGEAEAGAEAANPEEAEVQQVPENAENQAGVQEPLEVLAQL